MKRNVSVVRFKFHFNILISGKIIKEMPGSVASGTSCTSNLQEFTTKIWHAVCFVAVCSVHHELLNLAVVAEEDLRRL